MENQTRKHSKSITEPLQTVFSINSKDGTYLQLVYTIIFLVSRNEMIFGTSKYQYLHRDHRYKQDQSKELMHMHHTLLFVEHNAKTTVSIF